MTIDPELGDRERSALDVWEPMTPPAGFADRVLAVRGGRRWLPYAATAVTCGAAAAIIAALLAKPGQTLPDAATVAFTGVDAHEIDAAAAPIDYEMMPLAPEDGPREYDLDGPPGPRYDSGFWIDGGYVPLPLTEKQFDVEVEVGETFVVHTPTDVAYIKFHDAACTSGITAQIDPGLQFNTRGNPNHSGIGVTGAVVEAESGSWHYRVYCGVTNDPKTIGQFTVIRDNGSTLSPPLSPPVKKIDPDGRVWKISYQTAIPDFEIRRVSGGERFHLLDAKGNDRTIFIKDPTVNTVTVPGSSLRDGTYTFWFERGGVRVGLGTTLSITMELTMVQLSIDAPEQGAPAKGPVEVRVSSSDTAWAIAVAGKPLSSQATSSAGIRLSATTIDLPANHVVAIKATHPQRGIHYYIRRLR